MASKDKMKSIAFPTIGCGHLRYPLDLVARATFEEIERFSRDKRDTGLRDVRIVVYDKDDKTIDVGGLSLSR